MCGNSINPTYFEQQLFDRGLAITHFVSPALISLERARSVPISRSSSAMPPLIQLDEEDYDSAADSNFDATLSSASGDESDASSQDAVTRVTKGKKRKIDEDGDVEMASGDEGIVTQAKKKQKRDKLKGQRGNSKGEEDENVEGEGVGEGGIGIRVRLRSGRGG